MKEVNQEALKKQSKLLMEGGMQESELFASSQKRMDSLDMAVDTSWVRKDALKDTRKKVRKNMPPRLRRAKFNAVKNAKDRTVTDLKKISKKRAENRAFLEQNSIEDTREELELLDYILSGEYRQDNADGSGIMQEELTESMIQSLKHKRTMDQAQLLVNNHSYSDSDEMAAVKRDVLYFAEILEKYRDQQISKDNIEDVELAYKMLSTSCRSYLEGKDPSFENGKIRYRQVYELWMSVMTEGLLITGYKEAILQGNEGKTLGQVLGMTAAKEGDAPVPGEAERKKAPMSKDAERVAEFFESDFSFDAHFQKYYFKSTEADRIDDMLKKLKTFPPDTVQVMDLELMGKKVRLVQKSDNRLYLAEGGNLFSMGETVPKLIAKIEDSKLRNMDLYGKDSVNNLLDEYAGQSRSIGEHMATRSRLSGILADLSRKGRKEGEGLSPNQFANIRKEQMAQYLKDIRNGKKNIKEIEKEILAINKKTVSIEGVARQEISELKKALQGAAGGNDAEQQEEAIELEEGWSREEQLVKNLLADLIYTTDSGKMQLCLNEPASFVKAMARKHKSALYQLIIGEDKTLPQKVMKKMSMDGLGRTGDGKKQERKLSDYISQALGLVCSVVKAEMKADDLAAEEFFSGKLETLLDKKDMEDALNIAGETINEVVEASCSILQENVSKMTETIFSYDIQVEIAKEDELKRMRREASRSEKGQGKFMKNVLNKYFGAVSGIDKRSMLASAFRYCKEVPELVMTDQDAIKEIKKYRIKRYEKLFPDFNPHQEYELRNDEERKAVEEYKKEKQELRIQANLLGGLLRGAGPLLQKMMQGMPAESMPPEINEALRDMKSNLPPIPDDQVQDAFDQMVESSNKTITKIEKIRSLGAATVGQAFLCRIHGTKGTREVVIKLLRPEVGEKLQREEKIMLECAEETDHAMYLTYKGQLLTYKDELDLTIEKNNIKMGKQAYQGKKADVATIDVVEDIPATSTSLVLEKASGITVDRYMEELRNYKNELLEPYYEERDGKLHTERFYYEAGNYDVKKLAGIRKQLVDKIDEAIKRRDHLINLCSVWINQAVFDQSSGFYHGDLHAGNIMIDDEKATFIDYGNVVNLKDATDEKGERQNYILRMMLAAGTSIYTDNGLNQDALEVFFGSFNDIIAKNNDEEFNAMYTEEKKKEVKALFADILSKGDASQAGYRISVCLLKAQELGVKLPPAIANFSQGQIRLQNTIDELNKAIADLQNGVKNIDFPYTHSTHNFDVKNIVFDNIRKKHRQDAEQLLQGHLDSVRLVDEEEFKKALLDKTEVEEDVENNIRGVSKREDFKNLYLGTFRGIKNMPDADRYRLGLKTSKPLDMKQFSKAPIRAIDAMKEYLKYYEDHPEEIGTAAQVEKGSKLTLEVGLGSGQENYYDLFGGAINLLQKIATCFTIYNADEIRDLIDIYEVQIPLAIEIEEAVDRLHELQDKEDADPLEIDRQAKEIYEKYKTLKTKNLKKNYITEEVRKNLTLRIPRIELAEKQLVEMFAEKKDELGKKLHDEFVIIRDVTNRKIAAEKLEDEEIEKMKKEGKEVKKKLSRADFVPLPEDAEQYWAALDRFLGYYMEIACIQLKEYKETIYKDAKDYSIKYVDFDNVMSDVTKSNLAGEDGKISKMKAFMFATRFGKYFSFLMKVQNADV